MSITRPPGIYHDVPFVEYLAWDAVNNSSLSDTRRSMAHYRWNRDRGSVSSEAFRVGTFLHCGVLEPLAIAANYVVMPRYERDVRREDGTEFSSPKASGAYKALRDEFIEVNAGKDVVTQELYDKLMGVVKSLHKNARAVEYLSGGQNEVSMLWVDPVTGLLCKGRLDVENQRQTKLVDMKSTADASDFAWSIHKWDYDRQAAFYSDGYKVITGREYEFGFVVVEKEAPFGVIAATMGERTIASGRTKYQEALAKIAQCRETDDWPAYENPDTFDLPPSKMPAPELIVDGQVIGLA